MTITANRYNKNKPKLTLVLDADKALSGAAAVLEFGLKKYSRGNWQKGLPWTETLDSLLRHAAAFNAGEDIDPETNLPHVHHITCNALFLAQHFETNKKLDNRSIHES